MWVWNNISEFLNFLKKPLKIFSLICLLGYFNKKVLKYFQTVFIPSCNKAPEIKTFLKVNFRNFELSCFNNLHMGHLDNIEWFHFSNNGSIVNANDMKYVIIAILVWYHKMARS